MCAVASSSPLLATVFQKLLCTEGSCVLEVGRPRRQGGQELASAQEAQEPQEAGQEGDEGSVPGVLEGPHRGGCWRAAWGSAAASQGTAGRARGPSGTLWSVLGTPQLQSFPEPVVKAVVARPAASKVALGPGPAAPRLWSPAFCRRGWVGSRRSGGGREIPGRQGPTPIRLERSSTRRPRGHHPACLGNLTPTGPGCHLPRAIRPPGPLPAEQIRGLLAPARDLTL